MTVIVDANILFSALITPNGKLAQILANPELRIKRISCHFLVSELSRHHEKIVKYSKKSSDTIVGDIYYYLKNIQLFDENLIQKTNWMEAERLTIGVDRFDVSYVALCLQTNGWLWTGDKRLASHLKLMSFDRVLNTSELYEKLEMN